LCRSKAQCRRQRHSGGNPSARARRIRTGQTTNSCRNFCRRACGAWCISIRSNRNRRGATKCGGSSRHTNSGAACNICGGTSAIRTGICRSSRSWRMAVRSKKDYPETGPGRSAEANERLGAVQSRPAAGEGKTRKRHGPDDYDAATTPAGIANQIYNETASLRPTTQSGHGSDVDLQNARLAMSHVIHKRASAGILGGLGSDELSPKEATATRGFPSKAYDAFGASRYEALRANGPDPTGGATHFYMDFGQKSVPSFAKGKSPIAVYGPFQNTVRERGARHDQGLEYIKVFE